MDVKSIEPKPHESSLLPSLRFDVEIGYTKYREAILEVGGWLATDDEKIIAKLDEGVTEEVKPSDELAASGTTFDSKIEQDVKKKVLVAVLDRKALDHIEKRRMADRKGDVNRILYLNLRVIEKRAVISPTQRIKPDLLNIRPIPIGTGSGRTDQWEIVVSAYGRDYSPEYGLQWLISGDNSPVFLAISEQTMKRSKRIASTDWIHDYAPILELGEYFVVEIPKGRETIQEAWDYVGKAEECYRQWDTKGVYANCREAGSLLDRTIKEKFGKDAFAYKERWGRTYQRYEALASLDLHLEDIKKSTQYLSEDVKINKVDAEHVLILAKILVKYAEELLHEHE